jgi:hypothetical protein
VSAVRIVASWLARIASAGERRELRQWIGTVRLLARTGERLLQRCGDASSPNFAQACRMRAEAQAWRRRVADAEAAVQIRYEPLLRTRSLITLPEKNPR